MQRRQFILDTARGMIGFSLAASLPVSLLSAAGKPQVVWVENGEPEQLLKLALEVMGGLKTFISKGDVVVIKPNMGWDRRPEQAANTNPDLIRSLVQACFDAGAAKVKIFDRTCNNPQRCYRNSQIEEAAAKAGAEVLHVHDHRFVTVKIPNGEMVKEWPIYRDYLEADKVINVPVAKHHSLARVTLGIKNLMGVMGSNRGQIHSYFATKMTDIASVLLPTLTIIDAYRILLRNGPTGGDLNDVAVKKTLIVSDCMVSADATALSLFNLKLDDVDYIREAARRGLAKYDIRALKVEKIRAA